MEENDEKEWKRTINMENAMAIFKGALGMRILKAYLLEKGCKYISLKEKMVTKAIEMLREEKMEDGGGDTEADK